MTVVQLYPSTPARPTSAAANAALESNLGLIHKAVSSVPMPAVLREDAFQEAAVAFLTHYGAYDPKRAALSTFMWPHLRGAVLHLVRDEARQPTCISDDEILDAPVVSEPEFSDVDVKRFMRSLGPGDCDLIVRMYWSDEPLSIIARSIGISRQTLHVRHKRLMAQGRDHLSPISLVA